MEEALTIAVLAFFAGGFLLLERRCMGQISVVQPLVVCGVVGYLTGQSELGLWCGVTIQLLSVGQSHYANWALASIIASMTLIYSYLQSWQIPPGSLASVVFLTISIGGGIFSQKWECYQSKIDGTNMKQSSPWDEQNPLLAIELFVRKRILRGIAIGGTETLVGSIVSVVSVYFLQRFNLSISAVMQNIAAISVIAIGISITLGSLASYRYIVYAGVCAVLAISTAAAVLI